ncbi:SRA-YDG [Pluteus cervinus]|uniref:SRA-YDG n=1 Tax=Pluteus cervinus TaxID=181527 RepID=A0ACD3ATQ6_9AGAR|nr:SRA-YDG [Pluteus cervinus]
MAEKYSPGVLSGPQEFKPGTIYADRDAVCNSGVHNHHQSGVYAKDGMAESVLLSGAYLDDEDKGDTIIYAGTGGQDKRGNAIDDQKHEAANVALIASYEDKRYIRVIRSEKCRSRYAPRKGYRYDGLYMVTDYEYRKGISGYMRFFFTLKKVNANSTKLEQGHDRHSEDDFQNQDDHWIGTQGHFQTQDY